MSALNRLFERIRDELNDIGESIAGSYAQRILDQEIREIDAQLHDWRGELASFKANRLAAQERAEAAAAAIEEREAQAVLALQANNAALARDVAEVIAALEQEVEDERGYVTGLDERIAQMRQVITQGENTLRRLKHQLDTVRATESVQRAQATVAARQAGAARHLPTALQSAERVRSRSEAPVAIEEPEPIEAIGANAELDAKLRRAGILDADRRADAVMKRLNQRADSQRADSQRADSAAPSPRRSKT